MESERFNVIRISTDVTGTANMHTAKDEHYVDVTDGADINDHAMIEGNLDRDGYRLGFELYKQADGDDASKDTLTLTIPATDLKAATKELDSAPRPARPARRLLLGDRVQQGRTAPRSFPTGRPRFAPTAASRRNPSTRCASPRPPTSGPARAA